MRILFDHDIPRPLRSLLHPYIVVTAAAQGWERLSNGRLLDAAEQHDFDVLITGDKNMRFQQNLRKRKIAVIVLSHSKWPDVKLSVPKILAALQNTKAGHCTLVECMMSFGALIEEEPSS
jgi:hypothetical protein